MEENSMDDVVYERTKEQREPVQIYNCGTSDANSAVDRRDEHE
jgi:hypothetical protein